MTILPVPALHQDEQPIKDLLAASDLPFEDLTPAHLDHFLVLRNGDQLAGVVGSELLGDIALLRSLAVAPESRGQDLGSLLANAAETHARSNLVARMYLLTTTAEGFFTRRGYRHIDRESVPSALQATAEFRILCPSTAVCMIKEIG